VLDLRRAKILVKDFRQMDDVVKALMALGEVGGTIVIVSVKNRIGKINVFIFYFYTDFKMYIDSDT
jgi:hypothetical protein